MRTQTAHKQTDRQIRWRGASGRKPRMKGMESAGDDAVWKREAGKGHLSRALRKGSWPLGPDSTQPPGSSACRGQDGKCLYDDLRIYSKPCAQRTSPRPSSTPVLREIVVTRDATQCGLNVRTVCFFERHLPGVALPATMSLPGGHKRDSLREEVAFMCLRRRFAQRGKELGSLLAARMAAEGL